MDDCESQATHIIVQGEEDPGGFGLEQTSGTYIVKVADNIPPNQILLEKNAVQKCTTPLQERTKSDDTSTEPSMAFEIIHEPLNGDTLFDYTVFPQEDARFHEQNEVDKSSSATQINDNNGQASAESCENSNSYSAFVTTQQGSIEKAEVVSDESLTASLSSPHQKPHEIDSSATTKDAPPSGHIRSHDKHNEGDSDVIKKTTVEAFVKMVVCRKITVQKVDSKSGVVLDVDVRTEEEIPIVLGVDCVETTEDVRNGNPSKLGPGGISSKFGASMDGGLKFLSAVSESRQKIKSSLIGNALLQSSLPTSISKALCSENGQSSLEVLRKSELNNVKTENTEEGTAPQYIKTEDLIDDMNNDDSADYIPPYERKILKKPNTSSKVSNGSQSSKEMKTNDAEHHVPELPSGLEHEKSGSIILLPRRRGRKRRWDKALGLAANLKNCQFCNKQFESVKSCSKHMKRGECISALFCYICSKPFSSEELLEKHVISHGSSPKTSSFECNDCHRSYRTKAGYMKHFRMGTCSKRDEFEDGETGDFPCEVCGSRFSTVDYLKLHHYKVHENPKDLHSCPDCGKKFHSFLGFQRHRNGRPCTEPLKCHVCGKTYKAKESFKLHMKHHKSEISGVTYDCETCGRSYMTETALNKHKLSHTGVKPYKCETCGKEFAMRYQVKDHARMHTGERPYLCGLCGSAFTNKGHLGRHLRSHENGTLLRRGRPKKVREPEESSSRDSTLKLIDVGRSLQTLDGQTIQVVDSQMFDASATNAPMIIQADNNTIIIAEGWPANTVPLSQPTTSLPSSSE